jgi:hypothetical protein
LARRINPDEFHRGLVATSEETDMLCGRLVRWASRRDKPILHRLIVAARLTSALETAQLQNVRSARFAELVNVLLRGLDVELKGPPSAPTARQRGLLRQFAFACSEHVSLAELRAGRPTKVRLRLSQLRRARTFLRGAGAVPPMPGRRGTTSFERVETVGPAVNDFGRVNELLSRYIVARLESRSVFGDGYFGWPVFRGLGALWLTVAAVGWLARCSAATAARDSVTFDDFAQMLGVVDRAATRLPALGTVAERTRVAYLLADDGLARLLAAYALVPDEDNGRTGGDHRSHPTEAGSDAGSD